MQKNSIGLFMAMKSILLNQKGNIFLFNRGCLQAPDDDGVGGEHDRHMGNALDAPFPVFNVKVVCNLCRPTWITTTG